KKSLPPLAGEGAAQRRMGGRYAETQYLSRLTGPVMTPLGGSMVCCFQAAPVVMPVKSGAGIGFAAWRDVAVAGDARRGDARVARHDGAAEGGGAWYWRRV
ncbi:hypothetical protein HMPREF9080_00215, partial [Cardiobacterium valvarum F0432]